MMPGYLPGPGGNLRYPGMGFDRDALCATPAHMCIGYIPCLSAGGEDPPSAFDRQRDPDMLEKTHSRFAIESMEGRCEKIGAASHFSQKLLFAA